MQGVDAVVLGQFAQTALLGFGFGLVRGREGSLWAPIAVHVANNAWSTGLISWLRV